MSVTAAMAPKPVSMSRKKSGLAPALESAVEPQAPFVPTVLAAPVASLIHPKRTRDIEA